MAETGVKLEPLALGEATERTDAAVAVTGQTDEERFARIVAAFREAAALSPETDGPTPEAGAEVTDAEEGA